MIIFFSIVPQHGETLPLTVLNRQPTIRLYLWSQMVETDMDICTRMGQSQGDTNLGS